MPLNLSNFERKNLLFKKEDGSAKVFEVLEKDTGNLYSATISTEELRDDEINDKIIFSNFVNLYFKLNHPLIIKFKGYSPFNFKNKFKRLIMTEIISNGSLEDLLHKEFENHSIQE